MDAEYSQNIIVCDVIEEGGLGRFYHLGSW